MIKTQPEKQTNKSIGLATRYSLYFVETDLFCMENKHLPQGKWSKAEWNGQDNVKFENRMDVRDVMTDIHREETLS